MKKEKNKIAVIREELVALTGDYKKAIVLNQMIYWSERVKDYDKFIEEENQRLKQNGEKEIKLEHGWIYKKAEELSEETMMNVKPKAMRGYLKDLVDNEWLSERNNPKYLWDRTIQYRVNIIKIQFDLFKLKYFLEGYKIPDSITEHFNAMVEKEKSIVQKEISMVPEKTSQSVEKAQALSEITSEIIPKITLIKERAPKNGAPAEPEIEEDEMQVKQEDMFGEPEKPKLPNCPENVKEIHDYYLLMARDKDKGYKSNFGKERSQIKTFLKNLDWGDEPDIVQCVKEKMDIYFSIAANVKFGYSIGMFLTQFNSWTEENAKYQTRQSAGFTRNPVIPKGNSAGVYVDSNAGKFGWTQEDFDAVERKTIKG